MYNNEGDALGGPPPETARALKGRDNLLSRVQRRRRVRVERGQAGTWIRTRARIRSPTSVPVCDVQLSATSTLARILGGTPESMKKEAEKHGGQKMYGIGHSREIFEQPKRSTA